MQKKACKFCQLIVKLKDLGMSPMTRCPFQDWSKRKSTELNIRQSMLMWWVHNMNRWHPGGNSIRKLHEYYHKHFKSYWLAKVFWHSTLMN